LRISHHSSFDKCYATGYGLPVKIGDFVHKGLKLLSVTRNRRLTFRIDAAEHEIGDVNLEDYH
jgi:hypothetical protein